MIEQVVALVRARAGYKVYATDIAKALGISSQKAAKLARQSPALFESPKGYGAQAALHALRFRGGLEARARLHGHGFFSFGVRVRLGRWSHPSFGLVEEAGPCPRHVDERGGVRLRRGSDPDGRGVMVFVDRDGRRYVLAHDHEEGAFMFLAGEGPIAFETWREESPCDEPKDD
jgi:hypothetical protein